MYPGQSTLNGDIVYCDNNSVMWSPTLTTGTYKWAINGKESELLPAYAKGDCNNLKDKDIVDYPACQACRNLNYAGFSEGWYLPSQSKRPWDYCAYGGQFWDFGAENCSNWNPDICYKNGQPDPPQGSCQPEWWDDKAQAAGYWSSTQTSATLVWRVDFSIAYVGGYNKSTSAYVRCALGNYNK